MPTISSLPFLTTATSATIFSVVDVSSTVPASKRATLKQFKEYVLSGLELSSFSQLINGTSTVALDISGALSLADGSILSNNGDGLEVESHSFSVVSGANRWWFTSDGSLRFPDDSYQDSAWTGTVAYSNVTGAPPVTTSTLTNGIYNLILDSTGTVTLPSGATISGTNTNVKIITSPGVDDWTWTFGQDGTITFPNNSVQSSAAEIYNLPSATTSTIGGVIVGSGLQIDNGGVLSAGVLSGLIPGSTLVINTDETGPGVTAATGLAGIIISRGVLKETAASLLYTDNQQASDGTHSSTGSFIFLSNGNVTGIVTNFIRVSTGTSELNIFGTNNTSSVISVKGTVNYQNQVTQTYHIPNKKYVDDAITANLYSLPTASISTSGGVKIDGTTIHYNGSGQIVASLTNVVSKLTAGTAIAISTSTGSVTIANMGVTSIAAGSGISIDRSTGTVTITNTGGGGGGGSGLTIRASTSTISASRASGASGDYTLLGFKGYALLNIQTSAAAWVTVYNSTAARTADASRPITSDPTPGSGVIAEVITTAAGVQWFSPALIGYSAEASPSSNIPIKIYNNSGGTTAITVTATIIQLEI